MGSQITYNTMIDAPAAIIVKVRGEWFVAAPAQAWQVDRRHGGIGPVVLTYETIGLPYESEAKAQSDATLTLQRQEDNR